MLFYVFYHFCLFQNVSKPCDVTKLCLLQSRDLAGLIRALKHCFKTKNLQMFRSRVSNVPITTKCVHLNVVCFKGMCKLFL